MPIATKTVSARFPEQLLEEARRLCPKAKTSEMLLEAFTAWVKERRRQHADAVIKDALASIPPRQAAEERELATAAGRSALRIVEGTDV